MILTPKDLSKRRKEKGLTQQQVADMIDVSRVSYTFYEDGSRKPKFDVLIKILQILEFEIEDFTSVTFVTSEPVTKNSSYIDGRRRIKSETSEGFRVPLVPIKAQAGYTKSFDQAFYLDTLEKYAIPPGISYHGSEWRYWEIEGDSMEPTLHSRDIILTSQVNKHDWEFVRNFYIYVIVTEDRVLIKRVFQKSPEVWVLISDNEESHPQQLLNVDEVKELWVFRRHIDSKAPVPRKFEIKL